MPAEAGQSTCTPLLTDAKLGAALTNLCETADLLEQLLLETNDDRYRLTILVIDMARLHLEKLAPIL